MKLYGINKEIDFSSNLLAEIKELKQLQEKNKDKSYLKRACDVNKKLKKEYKELTKKINVDVKVKLKSVKSDYAKTKLDMINNYKQQLNELNAKQSNLNKNEFNEEKKALTIKHKRALKTYYVNKYEHLLSLKKDNLDFANYYLDLEKQILGKNTISSSIMAGFTERKSTTLLEKTLKDRYFWLSKISIFSFLFLFILYILICAIGGIKIEYEKIIEASSTIIVIALGGVFIYSMRSFDMSLGGAAALAAAAGATIWNKTNNIMLVLLVSIVIGVIIELINASLANVLKLPVMVTTLAMSSLLSTVLTDVLENTSTQTIKATGIKDFDTFAFYILVILVFFAICAFIFKISPVGRKNKMIGNNSVSARYTGINITKQGIITFIIAGVAIGTGALLYIVRSRTISTSSCSTIGLDVILAVVFGGMQVTGGAKSKISAAVFGGLTATLISYLLIAIGRVSGFSAITQYESFVKGLLFLIIVAVNTIGNRTNRLPAIELMW